MTNNKTTYNQWGEKQFEIRAYTKKELALCYFPESQNPHTAVGHLMRWITHCAPLYCELQQGGYQKNSKWFSPREVRLITEFLGEP